MDKIYRVQIVKIDPETNEEEQVLDDTYTGLLLCGNCGDGKMAEVILHDTILDIATRLAQGSKTKIAVRLANVMMAMKQDLAESAEAKLLRAIMEDM